MKSRTVYKEEIRVAIIGRTGSGKSSLGNSIFDDKNIFESDLTPVSVTAKTEMKSKILKNETKITIADTPGFFHTSMSTAHLEKEIFKCIEMTTPGPHVFLYTIKIGRYSEEEIIAFKRFCHIFGDDVLKHTALVFTGKDYLMGNSIDNYVQMLPEKFRLQIGAKKCNKYMKYMAFNNKAKDTEFHKQRDNLLALMDTVHEKNEKKIFVIKDKHAPESSDVKLLKGIRQRLR